MSGWGATSLSLSWDKSVFPAGATPGEGMGDSELLLAGLPFGRYRALRRAPHTGCSSSAFSSITCVPKLHMGWRVLEFSKLYFFSSRENFRAGTCVLLLPTYSTQSEASRPHFAQDTVALFAFITNACEHSPGCFPPGGLSHWPT